MPHCPEHGVFDHDHVHDDKDGLNNRTDLKFGSDSHLNEFDIYTSHHSPSKRISLQGALVQDI